MSTVYSLLLLHNCFIAFYFYVPYSSPTLVYCIEVTGYRKPTCTLKSFFMISGFDFSYSMLPNVYAFLTSH